MAARAYQPWAMTHCAEQVSPVLPRRLGPLSPSAPAQRVAGHPRPPGRGQKKRPPPTRRLVSSSFLSPPPSAPPSRGVPCHYLPYLEYRARFRESAILYP